MDKVQVKVCVGTSCHLMGSNLIIKYLETISSEVKKKITLDYISCMERCEKGPIVKIDDKLLENATPEKVQQELNNKLQEEL